MRVSDVISDEPGEQRKECVSKLQAGRTVELLQLFFVVDGPNQREAVAVGEERGDGAPNLRR